MEFFIIRSPLSEIKCIPTKYNGYTFRSRLEARWAVVFDRHGINWFYEYEGFQLDSGYYLPDFYFPALDGYVEIKPKFPKPIESQLCKELAEVREAEVMLIYGEIDPSAKAIVFTPTDQYDLDYLPFQRGAIAVAQKIKFYN